MDILEENDKFIKNAQFSKHEPGRYRKYKPTNYQ